MDKKEIIAELVKLGIAHDPKANKKDLEALLPSQPEGVPDAAPPTSAPSSVRPSPLKMLNNSLVFVKLSGTSKSFSTAERLAYESKERMVVFPLAEEGNAQLYQCGINGVYFAIVMGVEVELPKSVAEHVQKSRMANARAERNIMVVNPFTGEKVNVDLAGAPDETKRRLGIL